MFKPEKTGNNHFFSKFRKLLDELGIFVILVVLPVFTLWISFYHIQNSLLEDARKDVFNDLSEMTAHMIRVTEPETYYQDSLKRLAESFKWSDNIDDIPRIENKEILELALFDENGERLSWPVGENPVKTKFSKDYLKALKKFSESPDSEMTHEERNTAIGYSGNEMTLSALAASPNTLINFQGLGLRKMGGWFKVEFYSSNGNKKNKGDLIAWLNLDKIDRYSLPEKAIKSMERLTSSIYTFSYIDLKNLSINKCSKQRKLRKDILAILSSNSLKSNFIFNNELFSINDTQEGLRLICSRPSPPPLPILKKYTKFLSITIPVIVFLFLWKLIFKVSFYFSVKNQGAFIYTYASIMGFVVILVSTIAYQYEKHITITQKYQNEAIEILEKVDQQYSDSFDDLVFQYKHFNELISKTDKNPVDVLAPLLKAQKENNIAYAVYIDKYGKIIFQAPNENDLKNSSGLANRYNKLVNRVALKALKTFNSSRSEITKINESVSMQILTLNAVDGLLSNRTKFIEIQFDNDKPLAYLDLIIDNDDYAKGCLLIIHDPSKLEMNYLNEAGLNLSKTKDFELIAFPKLASKINSYYPKFSYSNEEPLWKLNDIVNQTQLPSFKKGKIIGKECIVAALPATKMKNYNLFLAMPIEKLGDKVFSLSNVLLMGTGLSLIFIIIISVYLINSIASPIKIIKKNAEIIKENKKYDNQVVDSDSIELESITNGLTNIVMKTKQFNDIKSIYNSLSTIKSYSSSQFEIDFVKNDKNNNTLSLFSILNDGIIFISVIQSDTFNQLNTTIPMVMAGTALKLFVEELAVRSPSLCISNLEEYFRINFKTIYNWNIASIFFNAQDNKITYSVSGKMSILECNLSNNCQLTNINKPSESNNSDNKTSDIDYELKENSCLMFIPETFFDNNYKCFEEEISNISNMKTNIRETFEKILSLKNVNTDFLCYINRKEKDIIIENKKILAGNNPIAFIRSNKIVRSIDG